MTEEDRHCSNCGWPTNQPFQVLSRHRTSEGIVVYTRCACGVVRMQLARTVFTI